MVWKYVLLLGPDDFTNGNNPLEKHGLFYSNQRQAEAMHDRLALPDEDTFNGGDEMTGIIPKEKTEIRNQM